MTTPTPVTLFHSPNTALHRALILIEELGADVALHLLDMKAGEQRRPEYLAINPMGKVPALRHGDALVTEQAGVHVPGRASPSAACPRRRAMPCGPYLRWMTFYGSCFEPAVVDRALKREAASPSTLPYGDFDTMLSTLEQHMAAAPGCWVSVSAPPTCCGAAR